MLVGTLLLLIIVTICIAESSFAAGGTPTHLLVVVVLTYSLTLNAGGNLIDQIDSIGILYQFDQILHDLNDKNSTLAVQTARKYLNIVRLNTGITSNINISHSLDNDVTSILGIKFVNETHFVKEKPVACNALEHLFLDYIVPARGCFYLSLSITYSLTYLFTQ